MVMQDLWISRDSESFTPGYYWQQNGCLCCSGSTPLRMEERTVRSASFRGALLQQQKHATTVGHEALAELHATSSSSPWQLSCPSPSSSLSSVGCTVGDACRHSCFTTLAWKQLDSRSMSTLGLCTFLR